MHISTFALESILVLAGVIIGSYSSVVGGGAFVLVPLYTILGMPLLNAIATMRVSATLPQLVTVAAFSRTTKIDWRPVLWMSLFAMPGGFLGAHMAIAIDQKLLAYFVSGVLLVFLPFSLHFDRRSMEVAHKPSRIFYPMSAAIGFLLGVYSGLYGAAFSTMVLAFLMLSLGQKFFAASGNASVVAFLVSLVASIPFIRAGVVNWHIGTPIIIGQCIGSWEGVNLAGRFGMKWVRMLLLLLIIFSLIKLLFFS